MDPKLPPGSMLLAPPQDSSFSPRYFPAHEPERRPPSIDDHVVKPETRDTLMRGRVVIAMPSLPPHADRHFKLDYLLGAHLKEGYVGSTDLLTRVSAKSNFASDTCIRKQGIDPQTDTRYLEEVAFEVVNEQSLPDVTDQAEEMVARGVRRIVAIFVKKREVCEWSKESRSWQRLDLESMFSDPTLARPIRVRDFLDFDSADDAVARALVEKQNPILIAIVEEERNQTRIREMRRAVRDLCEVLGMNVPPEKQAALDSMPLDLLDALRERIKRERRWD